MHSKFGSLAFFGKTDFKNEKSVVKIFRNENGNIYGFVVQNHTDSFVCAGLSVLTLNTINSIEALTDVDFVNDINEDAACIEFYLPYVREGNFSKDVDLLLNSFALGIKGMEMEYRDYIIVDDGGV